MFCSLSLNETKRITRQHAHTVMLFYHHFKQWSSFATKKVRRCTEIVSYLTATSPFLDGGELTPI